MTSEHLIEQINALRQKLEKEKCEELESHFQRTFKHLFSPYEGGEAVYTYKPPENYQSFTAKEIAKYIDHTILKPDATHQDIVKLCDEAMKFGFKAVCVNGARAELAKKLLSTSPIPVSIAVVVGFPSGASTSKSKLEEVRELVLMKVDEIDMVINIGDIKDGEYTKVFNEISAIASLCHSSGEVLLKVILECGALTKSEIITASILSIAAGADFIKTSTGFNSFGGAKEEDIEVMRLIAGPHRHVKASGGIRSYQSVIAMIGKGADRIGASAGPLIMSELFDSHHSQNEDTY